MGQLIQIIDYLRMKAIERHLEQEIDKRSIPWQTNLPRIDYAKLSKMALDCGMYYTAAVFVELSLDPIL